MGNEPKAHTTESAGKERDIDHYRLNLDPPQLERVAAKLQLNDKQRLSTGTVKPPDGELMLTFKGKYVRITYTNGQPSDIRPKDDPT
jgi:hypothetical protein